MLCLLSALGTKNNGRRFYSDPIKKIITDIRMKVEAEKETHNRIINTIMDVEMEVEAEEEAEKAKDAAEMRKAEDCMKSLDLMMGFEKKFEEEKQTENDDDLTGRDGKALLTAETPCGRTWLSRYLVDGRVGRVWLAAETPSGRTWLAFNEGKFIGTSRYFPYRDQLNGGLRQERGKKPMAFAPPLLFLEVRYQHLPQTPETLNIDDSIVPNREQYNKVDFTVEYAKFFVIKSINEHNIHKSIKYNFWTSNGYGNMKLHAAYQEAQQRPGGCPVFLFFSVNYSDQFVGVAEMIGPVDFNKILKYWRQHTWKGFFPVKWHIIKDVPNNLLRHITLDNNNNKPVTNSLDTQEVMLEPGLKLMKIFEEYTSHTCFLDDFLFYEARHKIILEREAKKQSLRGLVLGEPKDDSS